MANGEKGFSISWSTFMNVVGWVVAALLTYSAINARVSVVESEVRTIRENMTEIKNDMKTLLRKP